MKAVLPVLMIVTGAILGAMPSEHMPIALLIGVKVAAVILVASGIPMLLPVLSRIEKSAKDRNPNSTLSRTGWLFYAIGGASTIIGVYILIDRVTKFSESPEEYGSLFLGASIIAFGIFVMVASTRIFSK
jgi:hypothetical protein